MQAFLRIAALCIALTMFPVGAAMAAPGDECPGLTTGRVIPTPGTMAVAVPAPSGLLIDQYCIVTRATPGTNFVDLDPLTDMVYIDTFDGSDIVEYSVSFVSEPPGTGDETITVTVPPAPATIGQESPADFPNGVPAGDGSSQTTIPKFAYAVLALAVLALMTSAWRLASHGQCMSGLLASSAARQQARLPRE